jgi:hypothetical protein
MKVSSSSSCRCQTRDTTISFLSLGLEHYLDPELLAVLIKPSPISSVPSINFPCLELKSTGLIRLRSDEEILEIFIRWIINFLFEGRHKSHPRRYSRRDFLILKLEKQAVLSRQMISGLRDLVTGTADLDCILLHLHAHGTRQQRRILVLSFLLFSGRTTRKVGLMLAALSMRQIGTIVLMDCKT